MLDGLRTRAQRVWSALHARSEGCGVRASGRLVGKTHGAVIGWEKRAMHLEAHLPAEFSAEFEPIVESDELYTKLHSTTQASSSRGWTSCGLERRSRWCTQHVTGQRNESMFRKHTHHLLKFLSNSAAHFVSDGETRYASELAKSSEAVTSAAKVRIGRTIRAQPGKCLRRGLTIQRKVKGSQRTGPTRRKKYEIPLPHHPDSHLLDDHEVHANHCEAYNASLRRRCSAFRRRTNMYAKTQDGLDRALAVQRLIHNWIRPHWAQGRIIISHVRSIRTSAHNMLKHTPCRHEYDNRAY